MAAYEEELEENDFHIVMEDEYGTEYDFSVIGTFYMEGINYMGLHPEESEDPGEVVLLRFSEGPEDSVVLEDITDDEEYERAAEVFEVLFNEPDEDDLEDEERVTEDDTADDF